MNENKSEFEPKIVAFVCNWCTYAGADLTGTSRLKYATNVEIVRFPCTGRIDFMLLLKAFAVCFRIDGFTGRFIGDSDIDNCNVDRKSVV